MKRELLLSFVGNHDPVQRPTDDPGPVLSLLQAHRFDTVVLLVSGPDYAERAQVIRTVTEELDSSIRFSFVDVRLESVVDYEELYGTITSTLQRLEGSLRLSEYDLSVLLDPGTPQMQTIWFVLVQAGVLKARLLQGIPARFADGVYRYRQVRVDPERFPLSISLAAASGDRVVVAETPPEFSAGIGQWINLERPVVGESPAMQQLLESVRRVAPFSETVLLTGETGTGKEIIARSLHEFSRSDGPFVSKNCAAIAQALVESELFGHAKGAYTGATEDRLGAFRAAHGGTLLLDEVGELPLETQARLLRVLEEGEVTPVGADRAETVNVRIVAATNRNLHEMVSDGSFRADLYERLRAIPLEIPPLRDRGDDVRLLIDHFSSLWNTRHSGNRRFSAAAIDNLAAYHWPRNVRQLSNVVNRLLTFASGDEIDDATVREALDREDSPGFGRSGDRRSTARPIEPERWTGTVPVELPEILRSVEERWYSAAIHHARGNRAEAARLLGVNPPAFRKALRDRFPELRE